MALEPIAEIVSLYAEAHTTPDDPVLSDLCTYTNEYHPEPGMLSGQVQGRFLQMISSMIMPEYILEVGTMTGYASICLSKGLKDSGELHTIELREKDALIAEMFFKRTTKATQIFLHIGNAKEILDQLHRAWDLVFIDADKVSYIEYYEKIIPSVKKGGYILADNVLFHGHVVEETLKGKNAKAIHAFNEYVRKDERVECVLLTIRDGLMLIRKK
ncbi:MAG: O-methyltransferase [Chitinophagaceae bacterium]